jgi:hypothetical protein
VSVQQMPVRLFLAGRARTKGSLKPDIVRSGRGALKVTMHDTPLSQAWKLSMVKQLRQAYGITTGIKAGRRVRTDAEPYAGPVEIHAFFRFEQQMQATSGHPPWPSHDTPWPTANAGEGAIGDEDKLRRNLLDALTQSGVIKDDCWSIGGVTLKRWCAEGEEPGVEILVRPASAWARHIEWIMLHEDDWQEGAAARLAELDPEDLF